METFAGITAFIVAALATRVCVQLQQQRQPKKATLSWAKKRKQEKKERHSTMEWVEMRAKALKFAHIAELA